MLRGAALLCALAGAAALRVPMPTPAAALAGRRAFLAAAASALGAAIGPAPRAALAMPANPAPAGVNLEDVPPQAAMAYRQYWTAVQLAGDYYAFELRDLVAAPNRWDLVAALMESKSIGSAQSPSRLEREFLSPMRILALAFPPDLGGDDMRDALDGFQRAMFQLNKLARSPSNAGQAADPKEVAKALAAWEAGREQLNGFFAALNGATESQRLTPIPPGAKGYPRSKALYTQLNKDLALCRNRGGEQLAGIWGLLMVYGTAPGTNPCGSVNLATYFDQ
jgi:hypothetical protein